MDAVFGQLGGDARRAVGSALRLVSGGDTLGERGVRRKSPPDWANAVAKNPNKDGNCGGVSAPQFKFGKNIELSMRLFF